jgi:hypothetical protein
MTLEDRLRRHGEAVATFITRAQQIPPVLAASPRAPGKWTPIEEAVHLTLIYREYTAVFGGAAEFTLLVPPDKATHYRGSILPRILAGNWFPSGAAAPDRVQPHDRHVTMPTALAQLRSATDRFHAAAESAASAGVSKAWMHPYFGPLSLPDLVDLLTEHANHHARFLVSSGAG